MPVRSGERSRTTGQARAAGPRRARLEAGRRALRRAAWAGAALALLLAGSAARAADSPWLYGIHWYGDPAGGTVEVMTGGKGIWSLEIVETSSDIWWSAAWQRDYRFQHMVARGHTLIVRIERTWGETVPFPEHLAQYLVDVQAAAQALAGTCHIWQIGNEMNLYGEWGGNVLSPAAYVDAFRQIRAAIRSVPSALGEQVVLVGPVSPGGVEPGVRHTDGLEYLGQMCSLLAPGEVDGFALHAYAAPWHSAGPARAEFQAGYLSQLAVIDTHGLLDRPVYITEWNRRVDPLTEYNEAQSAQFLHGALVDLHAWNQTAGGHPVSAACWFIYQYDSGTWAKYSIEYLHGIGPGGQDQDLWDALACACTLNLPTAAPPPGASPRMFAAVPPGVNVAPGSAAVSTSSGTTGALAIDGIVAPDSKWTSAATVPPHWLQLDLGRERRVSGYIVRHAGAAGEPAYFNTQAFALQTAPTAAGPWEVEALVFNPGPAASSARTYFVPRSVRHVRLLVTDPGVDSSARIPEFEVYVECPPGDYDGDGATDADDLPALLFCLRGPDATYAAGHACLAGDADGDRDVDLRDLAAVQRAVGN